MNYAMTRTQGNNGLQTAQFYNHDFADGEVRTIARNPLCAYSEVNNVTFVKNELLDKYLSDCKEIIYFNQQSDILALMSSADTDGDACTVIDNEIIKTAVVVPPDGKYFWNKDDGHKEKMPYNSENKFIATYRASGNLIGRIALKSASVNSDSQLTEPYYDVEKKAFVSMDDIEAESKEVKEVIRDAKLESKEWVKSWYVPEEHKALMRKRFADNEKDIYTVLYNAMVSIDAPKTLYFPDKEDMKVIDDKYDKQAYFLRYKVPEDDVIPIFFDTKIGLLDRATSYVESALLSVIREQRKEYGSNHELLQSMLINGDYDIDTYEQCKIEMHNFYKNYACTREEISKEKSRNSWRDTKNREELIDDEQWNKYDEEDFWYNLEVYRENAYLKYKDLDKDYIVKAADLTAKYTLPNDAVMIELFKQLIDVTVKDWELAEPIKTNRKKRSQSSYNNAKRTDNAIINKNDNAEKILKYFNSISPGKYTKKEARNAIGIPTRKTFLDNIEWIRNNIGDLSEYGVHWNEKANTFFKVTI